MIPRGYGKTFIQCKLFGKATIVRLRRSSDGVWTINGEPAPRVGLVRLDAEKPGVRAFIWTLFLWEITLMVARQR